MLRRKGGATLDQICQATGWQRHTTRGFISVPGGKYGLQIESTRRDDGARVLFNRGRRFEVITDIGVMVAGYIIFRCIEIMCRVYPPSALAANTLWSASSG